MDGYLGYVTAAAAFGGLVLGVFNAWRAFIEDRVKIRVTVSPAKRDDGVDYLNVIIVNMSKFPVAISDVALALKNGGYRRVGRRSFGLGQSIDSRRSRSLAYWLQGEPGPGRHIPRGRGVLPGSHRVRHQVQSCGCTA